MMTQLLHLPPLPLPLRLLHLPPLHPLLLHPPLRLLRLPLLHLPPLLLKQRKGRPSRRPRRRQ
jgi:hypothetical protein